MIEVEGLEKSFGAFPAVRGLSFEVRAGETLALLGPNGAGKTTTVRILSALLEPSAGRVRVGGFDVQGQPSQVHAVVGLMTERPGFYPMMTAWSYLLFFGELYGLSKAALARRAEELLQRFGLWESRNKPLGAYSAGMRQRMALVRALIHDPVVLFLDEPTSALDPVNAKMVREYIRELRSRERAIVICTHNLPEAENLADTIAIIKDGVLLRLGTLEELTRELLGKPRYELLVEEGHTARAREVLSRRTEVLAQEPGRLVFAVEEPRQENPAIMRALVRAGCPVISLREAHYSLESVYLSLISD